MVTNRARLSLLAYAGIAVLLWLTVGMYTGPAAVWAMVVLAALLVLAVLAGSRSSDLPPAPIGNLELAIVLVLFSVLLWLNPVVLYGVKVPGFRLLELVRKWSSCVLLIVSILLTMQTLPQFRFPRWFFVAALLAAVAALGASRLAMQRLSPNPLIDVHVINNLACDYFLHGKNPYAAQSPETYQGGGDHRTYKGQYDYRPAFFYWPAYLYWSTPFRWALGDVRYGHLCAELLAAWLLTRIGKRLSIPPPTTYLFALLWLMQPVSLFVLDQAWIDPVLVLGVAGLALALVARQWTATGALLAFVCGVKQYGVLIVLLTLLHLLVHERQHLRHVLLVMAAGTAALFGPFLLLDARHFYDSTIAAYLHVGIRRDALSVPTLLANQYGRVLPEYLMRTAYALWIVGCCWWLARVPRGPGELAAWAGIMACAYLVFFLFGKLAFCNYYYFVEFLILLFVMMSQGRPDRHGPESESLAAA